MLTLYRDEPFDFHNELMYLFLDLLKSNVSLMIRSRLKKFYKFSYLIGLLIQDKNELFDEEKTRSK